MTKITKVTKVTHFLKIRNGKLHIYKSGAHHSVILGSYKTFIEKRPFLNKNTGIRYDYHEIRVHRDKGVVSKTTKEENRPKTTRPADPWWGPRFNRLEKYESQGPVGSDFYISRSDHLRFGRILGHFWGRSHFTFDQSTKVQTILVLLETSKNEGEELYWCFVVLKWVNYKNVLHRKMCNLGHTLSHV